jgi:hypothetical protein
MTYPLLLGHAPEEANGTLNQRTKRGANKGVIYGAKSGTKS